MTANELQDFKAWKNAIGHFATEFAEAEWWTYRIAREVFGERVGQIVVEMQLEARAKIVKSQLLDQSLCQPNVIEEALGPLKGLCEFRNLVIHNPPAISVYTDAQGDVDAKIEVRSARKENKLASLEEITERAQEAQDIARRIYAIASMLISNRLDKAAPQYEEAAHPSC